MTWPAIFVVFFATHQCGDYLLQTDWQATHKRNGLGRDPRARRALLSHTFTYSLAYVPAFIWIQTRLGWETLIVAAVITIPHLIQDDGRLLRAYLRNIKRMDPVANHVVAALVDQALHMIALFGTALLISALI
jgi:hypothetical protein